MTKRKLLQKLQKQEELLNLLKKHILSVHENPKENALDIVISCNFKVYIMTFPRLIHKEQDPIQPLYGPSTNFHDVPFEDTVDIDKFKELWEEVIE